MKTRLATLTAILATATLALTACAGGSGSTTAQSEQTTQEASASSTRTITDHAGNEVVLPSTITRVAIDQIPIESTYLAYFDGKAPYLVGMSAARVKAMSQTIAAEMAPEMMQVDTSYYDKGELNAEALLNLNVDVVFYNAFNKEHGEMFRKAGIPAVGFTTLGNPPQTHARKGARPPPPRGGCAPLLLDAAARAVRLPVRCRCSCTPICSSPRAAAWRRSRPPACASIMRNFRSILRRLPMRHLPLR